MNAIRTDYVGKDVIEMTAVELPWENGTTVTRYFVDFYKDGFDNLWSENFDNEVDAHEYMNGQH